MAFVTPLDEIDEDFFKCLICLNQLREPKLLPCLHRCCTGCLKPRLEGPELTTQFFQCPKCKYKFEITPNVLDSLMNDLYMNILLHFIDLKNGKDLEGRDCRDCKNKVKLTAYCFKCSDFLCDQCRGAHATKELYKEHRECVIVLQDVGLKQLVDKGLAFVEKTTKCNHHEDKIADLCCGTCGNLPLCITCGKIRDHTRHDVYAVNDLAQNERRKLKEDVEMLDDLKDKVHSIPSKVESVREKLDVNASTRMDDIQKQYDSDEGKAIEILEDDVKRRQAAQEAIQKGADEDVAELTEEMKSEIEKITEKYNNLIANRKADSETKILELEEKIHGPKAATVTNELHTLKSELKYLTQTITRQQEENVLKLNDASDESSNLVARYDNVRSTASMIFATKSKWLDTRCIPCVRDAFQTLINDIKRAGYQSLESLSEVNNRDLSSLSYEIGRIPNDVIEADVEIEGRNDPGFCITGMTNCGDGLILIISETTPGKSIATFGKINDAGEVDHYNIGNVPLPPGCRSTNAPGVLPFASDKLYIFDACNQSEFKKIIQPVLPNGSQGQSLLCAAFDPVNKRILMCSDSRDVNVLDEDAKFSFAFPMPKEITRPNDIAIHKNYLAVCDLTGRRAFIMTLNGSETCLQEINKPNVEGGNWGPLSVCFDREGFIYMLWEATIRGHRRCKLIQFSQDGQIWLTTKTVDPEVKFLAISYDGEVEKLVAATWTSSKLYIYELSKNADSQLVQHM